MTLIPDAVTVLHVGLGTLAVAAGAIALAVRKGAPIHIGAGRAFAVTMGLASLLGAILGLANPTEYYITFHAGILGTTLIASSWLSARLRAARPGWATLAVAAANLANFAGLVIAGVIALGQPEAMLFGFAATDYFFLSAMAGLAVIGDASLVFRGVLGDRHRIARHLWRMCLGFFIAAGSAFTGPGASAFPEAVRRSGVLAMPELLILLALLFWLVRTWWKGAPQLPEKAPEKVAGEAQ
ncbi:hypothetical protein [Aquisalinus flavus]|uniref:DUF2306 domain-containing protein n=1 Tax=Aquisalinus flavus TaxID=1526572 RepID=A0A8J2V2J5_9PROT|nr:hypothetical protein [Aquisalinus flavus]MBD0427797.1 hypothetical protein [Aquisalinus flavus]UNE47570.1 hypothetical protein FF099_05610 [Aquisalinus flavus]GGD03900.1 hypothetical protein GCM10011342_11120 [Aquisalinus flavus]